MSYSFGFIGTGNMGAALAQAVSKMLLSNQIVLTDYFSEKAQALADILHCDNSDNITVARESEFIFLGVKPHNMANTLKEIQSVLKLRPTPPVLISMAAGLTIDQLEVMAGGRYPIIRIMPNTAVAEGEGVILYTYNNHVTQTQLSDFSSALSKAGVLARLDESLIDAGTAIAGCGPAFTYMFIDALADGGVACGLSRNDALAFATQTIKGAAHMIAITDKHPEQLKNEVCSPGGSTIQGVKALEDGALRATCMNAVMAAYQKNKDLKKS